MPKLPIKYINTVIFKIVSTDEQIYSGYYFGHTTDFNKTKNRIKTMVEKNNKPNGKYAYLWGLIHDAGWDEFQFLEVSKFPCKDGNEADAEVFRIQRNFKLELLNKQFEADTQKIKAGETLNFKHKIKPLKLKY